jgi:hypothetical protein
MSPTVPEPTPSSGYGGPLGRGGGSREFFSGYAVHSYHKVIVSGNKEFLSAE